MPIGGELVDRYRHNVRNTLSYYAERGLGNPIICGGSSLMWQLMAKCPEQIDRLQVPLADIDALAPYISILALHSVIAPEHITDWRDSPVQQNRVRDRATLGVKALSDSILPLQVFTGIETDRISITHDDVSLRGDFSEVDGIRTLSIARTLAWKTLADREKDRFQVPLYLDFIKQTRAVTYDEWDEIRSKVDEAKVRLATIKREEFIRWGGSG